MNGRSRTTDDQAPVRVESTATPAVGDEFDVRDWAVPDLGDGMAGFRGFFETEIASRFDNDLLARRSDSAILPVGGERWATTCDAFVVEPLFFPGGDIGKMAVCGVANDLLTEAARPEYLLMSLLVNETLDRATLLRVLDSVRDQLDQTGGILVGGDTKTLPAGTAELVISLTGWGRVRRCGPPLGFDRISPGNQVVITGPVGGHAIAVLSAREGLGFENVVRSDCRDMGVPLGRLVREEPGVRALRDASRGGVLAVLHELTSTTGLVAEIDVAEIPVQQEVVMAGEMLGLDVLELANEGCVVLFVDAEATARTLRILHDECDLPQAAAIGSVRPADGEPGRVLLRRDLRVSVATQSTTSRIPRLC